jgi:hypothetical protein
MMASQSAFIMMSTIRPLRRASTRWPGPESSRRYADFQGDPTIGRSRAKPNYRWIVRSEGTKFDHLEQPSIDRNESAFNLDRGGLTPSE